MIAWLVKIDHAVFSAVNSLSGASFYLDALWVFFSSVLIFIMFAGVGAYFFLKRKTRLFPAFSAFASSLAAFGVSYLIGLVYYRPRPFLGMPDHVLIYVSDLSKAFPSSHASAAFGLAFGVFFWNRKWGSVLLIAACLVSLGRILVGVHYPSDVAAGCLLGFLSALAIHRLVHLAFKKQIKEVIK